jgi:hypothetical protein
MWPRIALWIAGFVAVPLAKYVWESILEPPSYQKDFEKINEERAAKEKAEKEESERIREELKRIRNNLSEAGARGRDKFFGRGD